MPFIGMLKAGSQLLGYAMPVPRRERITCGRLAMASLAVEGYKPSSRGHGLSIPHPLLPPPHHDF